MHDWLTFELQRRINQPFDYATKMLADSTILDAGLTLGLDGEGLLSLQAPFRPASFPYEHALHAPAVLTSSRGRRVALIRLEITAWSDDATALALRPLSTRPDHWTAHHIQHYFALAHLGADVIAHLGASETAACRG
jgi:hypothetical protein